MSEFTITCSDFEGGEEIPKRCGYKHGNMEPKINFDNFPENVIYLVSVSYTHLTLPTKA